MKQGCKATCCGHVWLVPTGGAAAANIDTNDRSGLQLHLQDLNLDNVDAVEGLKLNIQASSLLLARTLTIVALAQCHTC